MLTLNGVSADLMASVQRDQRDVGERHPDYATTADIGDGTITITEADGTEVSFTVNDDTTIAYWQMLFRIDPPARGCWQLCNCTDLNIADSGQSVTGPLDADASQLIRVTYQAGNIREGCLFNDLPGTDSYNIRDAPELNTEFNVRIFNNRQVMPTAIAEFWRLGRSLLQPAQPSSR